MVASTPAGDFLPFQQVWGGKVAKSLPSKEADGMAEALKHGFVFSTAASTTSPRSHFTTLKSMIEYVDGIVVPFIDRVVKEDNLPTDQKFILLIDVYPVHAGEEFRDYIHVKHPRCILIFIPGNCTGKFQPADVGLQRPVKHRLKQAQFQYLVSEQKKQLEKGITAEKVKFSTSIVVLRDASVRGCVETYDLMCSDNGRKMVKCKATSKMRAYQATQRLGRSSNTKTKEYRD